MKTFRWIVPLAAAALAGCATQAPPAPPPPPMPAQWQAPLPHGGQAADLARWWQQFDDPLLPRLIDAAQAASPTLAAARSRIEQARAARVAGGAALGPTLDGNLQAQRGSLDVLQPVANRYSIGLQAGWELDLFGGNRAGRDAAQLRLEGAEASWHEARVSVAAETASAYLGLRACEAAAVQTEIDARSRAETSRLTALAAQGGFQAPAAADLARASAAQGNSLLTQQRAACELAIKALVALTALPEPALRAELAGRIARLPAPAQLAVTAVPAEVLAQRPDLFAAERELGAAGADLAQSRAQRYPRVMLAGSIAPTRFESGPVSLDGTVWSVGPITVSLPIFDGGVRRANTEAASARYDAATSSYAARLRAALREVEEALITLQSTAERNTDALTAVDGFERSYRAVEQRYRGGLATLFELEDARRSAVIAQLALIDLQRDRVAAWIALYRALGGGWTTADVTTADGSTPRR